MLDRVLSQARQKFAAGEFESADQLLEGFSERVLAASKVTVHGARPAAARASVVIVSHRANDLHDRMLAAIASQCLPEQWEVVLVANGYQDIIDIGARYFSSFVGVEAPFPLGCSAGRNLGAAHASADVLVFIDDDGIVEPGCIPALANCLDETGAVAARGKVLPLDVRSGPHYDYGNVRIPSFVDCEGVSAWRRQPFMEHGGFHVLLQGHEGLELSSRLWREYGPLAFVYEPSAMLRHEFGEASTSAARERRYSLNRSFLEACRRPALALHLLMQAIPQNGRQLFLASNAFRGAAPTGGRPVSVITTARNAANFIVEYTACWKRQTQNEFELIFVDDGSGDATADLVRQLWQGDSRLRLLEQPGKGRGAALNVAVAAASHEICLIADADDISIPSRVARTSEFFEKNPHEDYLSFVAFNELDFFRCGPPASPFLSDMNIRSMFHMPASFPTFAFYKSRFTEPFNEGLTGGIDCDWLHRNMEVNSVRGQLVQYPAVYYRRHERQITRNHYDRQREARERLIHFAFSKLLGRLSDEDRRFIRILVDEWKASIADRRKLATWVMHLLQLNDELGVYDPSIFRQTFVAAFDRVRREPTQREIVHSLRLEAERHIEDGNYKKARRALHKALRLCDDADIRARLLGAHRFAPLRLLSRSTPYRPS